MTIIRTLDTAEVWAAIPALADLLVEAVDAGASVDFLAPLDYGDAVAFWTQVAGSVGNGDCVLIVAEQAKRLIGTVCVNFVRTPNQRHRAEIDKLIVALEIRRNGLGRRLMMVAEKAAAAAGRTLLTLQTRAGDKPERLYRAMGWTEVGRVPRFARAATGRMEDTVFFYKELESAKEMAAE
ncbi:GNAT family N-acetyltransferase [Zavarzinia compransoris]|uniref:GNAT family N-acetyltransferase n=1 Tax=Zavarzinia marina TaxID=2911065 RepID=UPI001F1E02B7|nr:GNAT family N-acetyltransferase [Zavarzinia marina]MCF4166540.1 GNAT family N-acetyltransferase [Zavarzinia marina]